MKRVYELDVHKLAETLSDMIWHDFDKWNKFEYIHQKHEGQISIFVTL